MKVMKAFPDTKLNRKSCINIQSLGMFSPFTCLVSLDRSANAALKVCWRRRRRINNALAALIRY